MIRIKIVENISRIELFMNKLTIKNRISPSEVIRENGFWTHPDFPDFGEVVSFESGDFKDWMDSNSIKVVVVSMEGDADAELVESWFDEGLYDCSFWNPAPPADNAFLLSIHDTEDGPYAWWAIPSEK